MAERLYRQSDLARIVRERTGLPWTRSVVQYKLDHGGLPEPDEYVAGPSGDIPVWRASTVEALLAGMEELCAQH